ncbi:hypothetical protein [Streptomyces sp. MP131-18]|uniref:hypothetical protein n=1 Tax=Streptomyces sp. MP131-18 TaxID=1857892 RepID=UPI00097C4B29|nr:hypothetical protein [Streptomyces sp. MP131-18]ONK13598.1 hypothetical protein STBA_43680 [Streptomyces sp. MP131-18]
MLSWTPPRSVPRRAAVGGLACVLLAAAPVAFAAAPAEAPPAFTISDPRITESSGLAASRLHSGVYWTHNDQDVAPNLYAIDGDTGETLATITLSGATGRDLEAISLGPDGALYVGDIGDNYDGEWPEVWIYRLPEPEQLADATVTPAVYRATYSDGPRDAEALMVHPETGRVYLVSKKQDGGAALYAGPAELSETEPNVFERQTDIDLWVTDGAFSPDGTRLLLRGYFTARMYRFADGVPEPIERRVIPPVQRQGESVTFTPDGRTLMFGTEGEGSQVEPVELSGDLLPESAAAQEAREDEDGGGDDGGTDGAAGGDEGDEGGLSVGVTTALVVGVLAVLGLRRLLRGGGTRS